jgi:tripartite ATP-independent transporter DctM subunit
VTLSPGIVAAVMFGGFALLITLRVPVSFALGIACLPIFVLDDRLTPVVLITEMAKSYNAFILLAVPFFLLAANIMNSAGITERLVAFTRTMVGHFRGGLAQINVVVSMIFAGISGSSTADAAGEGSLIIPAMRREGYDASFTVAITACSSVMGVIIPPSILMVVWGGIMSVSIGGLFLAGFLPGLLVGVAQMIAVHFYARARNYPVYPRATAREFLRTLANAVLAIMSPVIVVGGVVGGFVTPTEAAVLAVLWSFFVGVFLNRSLAWREVPRVLYSTARLASISLFCIGTASAFGWLLAYYRIPKAVVGWLAPFATDLVSAGLVIAAVFLVIGGARHHHRGPAAGAARPVGRDASDPLRDHRGDIHGVRARHTALRPLPAHRLRDREDPRPRRAPGRPRHPVPHAGRAPRGDPLPRADPGAPEALHAEVRVARCPRPCPTPLSRISCRRRRW